MVLLFSAAVVSCDDNTDPGECTSSELRVKGDDVSLIPGERISGIAVVCCDSVLYDDVICPDNL